MKKSFIFVLLSIPLFLGFTIGMGILAESLEDNDAPLGYVDHSGLLSDPIPLPDSERVDIIAYSSETQAEGALEAGEIQAYYVLPAEYFEDRQVDLVYYKEPGGNARSDFYDFLQINLIADHPTEVINRVYIGNNMIIRSPDGSREMPDGAPTLASVLPLFISVAFIGLVLFSAGYMLEGISEEKLNRTIEVVFTSVSPRTLIGGKVLGIFGINALQLFTWTLVGIIAVFVAANVLDVAWFQSPSLNWGTILITLAIGIPTYITATALMLAVGSTIVEAQEGQAVGMIFYMLMISPMIAIVAIGQDPNGPLAVLLTLLPFTSLLTISIRIRNLFITIPSWQIAVSLFIQWSVVFITLWIAVRAFRLGMLRFGQRLRLREIIGRTGRKEAQGGRA
jgi:ABC-2 type transport system permease protein